MCYLGQKLVRMHYETIFDPGCLLSSHFFLFPSVLYWLALAKKAKTALCKERLLIILFFWVFVNPLKFAFDNPAAWNLTRSMRLILIILVYTFWQFVPEQNEIFTFVKGLYLKF